MSERTSAIRAALADAFGLDPQAPLELRGVGGGSINVANTCEVAGRRVFVKWNDRPLAGQFAAEAAGLEALRQSGTRLRIPAVIAFSDAPGRSFLILEQLDSGPRIPDFEAELGRGLAELHRASDARGFGFEADGYCGATPQPNGWLATWPEFYGERRLAHQLRLGRARGLERATVETGERVIARLPELVGPPEPSALIHGDLWSGNLHECEGRPGLIDPAAYYGHREAELGMMVMFGGFSQRVFDAYDEAFPLAAGWRERLDLYTAYHALNHYTLFGGGYGAQAARLLRRYR